MLALAAVMVCCVLGGVWVASGRAGLARERAETAADLAALAGAQALARAEASPCAAAGVAAAANGGRLLTCTVMGDALAVSVGVSYPVSAAAQARAGPQPPQ